MNRTMVDIEATGLNPKIDGLLQVAMVECYFNTNSKVWSPEHKVNVFFESTAYPKTLFAKKYQADLYRECREKGIEFKTGVSEVQDFLEGCEKDEDGRVVFMGWNASFFDLPFLVEKGVLVRPGRRFINRGRQKREIPAGNFSHRIFDTQSLYRWILDMSGLEREDLDEEIEARKKPFLQTKISSKHDGLFDCYDQIADLNAMNEYVRDTLADSLVKSNQGKGWRLGF